MDTGRPFVLHEAIKNFSQLLEMGRQFPPKEGQQYVSQQLPVMVANSNLHWWKRGASIPQQGKRLLIGVAPYSQLDLELLDQVNAFLEEGRESRIQVDVFNTLECTSNEDFEAYVPGIGPVFQTPVAGLWEDGVLQAKAWGKAARELVLKTLGISMNQVPKP